MNRGGTLGSRHCHCMLQLPAFTQRFSKFYFLPTVSEPLQWTQPEWPASHKKPFRGKLNDLETRPSKAFKGLFECSREFRLSGCCISGWSGRPGGKTSRFWRKPTALCCLAVFFLHCFTLRHYFCKQKELVEKCIWFFLQQNKITTNSSVDTVFRRFLISWSDFYDPTFDGTSRRLSFRHHSLQSRRFSSRPFSRHLCLLNNSRFFHGWKCSGCTQAWGKPTSAIIIVLETKYEIDNFSSGRFFYGPHWGACSIVPYVVVVNSGDFGG